MGKRILALTLALALALPFPAFGAEETTAQSYDQAVAELRGGPHYNSGSERTYETDDCTIFIFDNGGVMRAPHNRIAIIYKAGSQPGEGVCIGSECPYPMMLVHGPDRLHLSEDQKTLTYAYLLEEDIDAVSLKAGIYTYTVDLPAGVTTPSYAPFSYEGLADVLANGADYTLEERLDGPLGSAILRWSDCTSPDEQGNDIRDYELYLVCKDGEPLSQRLILPSTINTDTAYSPTHQPPDSMGFSEDGKRFTYVYSFASSLKRGDTVLHDAGTYTYTVELPSGELSVTHEADPSPSSPALGAEGTTFVDVSPGDWFAPYVEVCVAEGLMNGVGDGQFAPGQILSGYECAVLALRLHDLGRGGDGTFARAPEEWGYATLSLPDGTGKTGYFRDSAIWNWRMLGRGDSGHCGFDLDTEEAQAWGRDMDYQTAVLKVNGAEYTGRLHLSGPGFLYFAPANIDDFNAVQDARYAPLPQDWWRDAWYYAEQHDLTDLLMAGNNERWDFAYRIAAVTDLPAINVITGLPDTGAPDTLELYRAGVLTGSDPYGTFDGYSHLTRAEAAAICARVLRPELRIEFSPKPLETYQPYTLTYLRDDAVRVGGPYRPMLSQNLLTPDCHILLRLDGTVLPLPEGYEIVAVGDGEAGLINWDAQLYGIMDSQGQLRACTRDEAYTPSNWAADAADLHNGYRNGTTRPMAFFNAQGEQVTPSFDWLGFINAQGSGFVGMDGAIYRIQFETP